MAAFIEQHTVISSSLGPSKPSTSSSTVRKATANTDTPSTIKLINFKKKKSRSLELLFPTKLYTMLNGVEELGLSSTVSWMPHGRAFIIKDRVLFINHVLQMFFKATKIRSFHRQLNLWGFKRISMERVHAWWHPSFARGYPEDLKLLVRTEIKGKKKPAEVPNVFENAPNFYEQDSHETESNIDKVESIEISDIKATDCPEEFEHLDQEFEESMFAIHNHSPRTTDCTANIPIQPGLLNVSRLPSGSDGRDLIYGALTSEKKSSWGGAGDLRAGNKIDSSNMLNMEGSCFSGRQHDIGSGHFSNFASQVQVNDDAYDEFSAFIDRTIQLP